MVKIIIIVETTSDGQLRYIHEGYVLFSSSLLSSEGKNTFTQFLLS